MFVVYGDIDSARLPVVSVRTSTGDSPPKVVASADTNGLDVRVTSVGWVRLHAFPNSAMTMVSLIFYSCTSWPGSQTLLTSNPQPWMWAFNYKQEMPSFELDANLNMHGEGGWGRFHINIPLMVPNKTISTITPIMGSEEPKSGVSKNSNDSAINTTRWARGKKYLLLHLHGIVMGAAFLLIFPTGTLAIRSGFPWAFKYHRYHWDYMLGW